MIEIIYSPSFIRKYTKLEFALQEEVQEKIKIFQHNPKDPSLKLHKLKGSFSRYHAFSVNYKNRIIVNFLNKNEVHFLNVGGHDVYK